MKKIILTLLCFLCVQISANARTIITYTTPTTVVTSSYGTIYSPPIYLNNGVNLSLGIGDTGFYYTNYPRYYRTYYPRYYAPRPHHHKIYHHNKHHGGKHHHRR